MTRFVLLSLILISFTACNKSNDAEILAENILEIEQYIADNNLSNLGEVVKTESGLHYIVEEEGDGNFPDINSTVKVNYKGYLTNNTIFDANPNLELPLSNVIKGWQEGIPKFSRGGSGLLLIPSALGYGSNGAGTSIPPDAVLVFEIDLLDF